MATTAQWGAFEWGEAEWGSIEEGAEAMRATGTITLTGAMALTTGIALAAAGTIALTGAASLTTRITMAAAGTIVITGVPAALRFRGNAAILEECGHPFMALANWKDPNSC
jgi:hypothetical protein